MTPRDVEWVPLGTDVNARAAALVSGRVDATMLTAPIYFKLEQEGLKDLGNISDHDDIYAPSVYLFKKATLTANPKLAESLMKAHAEAIKRFYDDKAFAVKAYMMYDKQDQADVERVYDSLRESQQLRARALHPGGRSEVRARSPGRRKPCGADEGLRLSQSDRQQPGGSPGTRRIFRTALRPGDQGGGRTQGEAGLPLRLEGALSPSSRANGRCQRFGLQPIPEQRTMRNPERIGDARLGNGARHDPAVVPLRIERIVVERVRIEGRARIIRQR